MCPAITKDLKTNINNEQILRKVSDVVLSSFFSEMKWLRFTPKEPGSSVPSSPKLVVSPPLCSCLKFKAWLWHQGPAQHFYGPSPMPVLPAGLPVSHHFASAVATCPSSLSPPRKPSPKAPLPSSLQDLPPQHPSYPA